MTTLRVTAVYHHGKWWPRIEESIEVEPDGRTLYGFEYTNPGGSSKKREKALRNGVRKATEIAFDHPGVYLIEVDTMPSG